MTSQKILSDTSEKGFVSMNKTKPVYTSLKLQIMDITTTKCVLRLNFCYLYVIKPLKNCCITQLVFSFEGSHFCCITRMHWGCRFTIITTYSVPICIVVHRRILDVGPWTPLSPTLSNRKSHELKKARIKFIHLSISNTTPKPPYTYTHSCLAQYPARHTKIHT